MADIAKKITKLDEKIGLSFSSKGRFWGKGVVMLPKQTNYNVGMYLRLSKDDERSGESLSIENQRKVLTDYIN